MHAHNNNVRTRIENSTHLIGTEYDAHGGGGGVLCVAQGGFNWHFHRAVRGRKEMQILCRVHTACVYELLVEAMVFEVSEETTKRTHLGHQLLAFV